MGPLTATGHLRFDPRADTVQSQPWWLILQCSQGWFYLYHYWMQRYGDASWKKVVDEDRINPDLKSIDRKPRLALVRPVVRIPAWGTHISVIRGEPIPKQKRERWGHLEGQAVQFQFTPDLQSRGSHYWLWVECPQLLDIREDLGLSREPLQRLHLTVAVQDKS